MQEARNDGAALKNAEKNSKLESEKKGDMWRGPSVESSRNEITKR